MIFYASKFSNSFKKEIKSKLPRRRRSDQPEFTVNLMNKIKLNI